MKTAKVINFFFVSIIMLCLFNGLVFGGDTDSLVVTEDGNVGIGTSNPTAALDVIGLIRANGRIQVYTNDVGFLSTIVNPIAPPDEAQTLISTLKKNTLENGDHNQLRLGFYANDDGGGSPDKRFFTSIEAVVEDPNNSTKEAGLRFSTNKAGAELERMRIDGNGNVGIGTTSPESKLHVKGRIQQGNRFFTYAISGNTTLNTEFSHDIYTCGASQVVHIEAAITHWSAGYRATVDKIFYMDSYTTLSADTILDNGTGTAGSWSFQRVVTGNNGHGDTSDKLRITHNAGSYHGGANYYIYIKSTCPIKEM